MEISENQLTEIIGQAVSAAVTPLQEKISALEANVNKPKPVWENPDWDGRLPEDMSEDDCRQYWAWMDRTYNISDRYGAQ